MNDLQKLIRLRGLTTLGIAEEIGHGYHITQKVVKGVQRKRRDGSFYTYANQEIQEAVAARLGLTHDQAWGAKSSFVLRRLIRQEIKKQAKQREQDLRQQWLNEDTIAEKRSGGNI